eukprot:TRINITY_DN4674_c0_g1_i2.p1 TRINITY_DN4674_c0_g1~~TRINITY_DN4674_c0_g1_i2.p1  ORF type:complete len:169 (-),score=36.78 TRINITY_DN4674_c0_g1_i2:39-488(-)
MGSHIVVIQAQSLQTKCLQHQKCITGEEVILNKKIVEVPAIVGAQAPQMETRMEHRVVVGVVEGVVVDIILLTLLFSMLGLQTIIYQSFLTHSAVLGVKQLQIRRASRQNSSEQNLFGDPKKKLDWDGLVDNVFKEEIVKLSDTVRNKS